MEVDAGGEVRWRVVVGDEADDLLYVVACEDVGGGTVYGTNE